MFPCVPLFSLSLWCDTIRVLWAPLLLPSVASSLQPPDRTVLHALRSCRPGGAISLSGRACRPRWAQVLTLPCIFLSWVVAVHPAAISPPCVGVLLLSSSRAEARGKQSGRLPALTASTLGHSSPLSLQDLASRWRDMATLEASEAPDPAPLQMAPDVDTSHLPTGASRPEEARPDSCLHPVTNTKFN